jgi:hypothetical protein
MTTWEIDARELTHMVFTVEAETVADAKEQAMKLWFDGQAMIGDTELEITKVYKGEEK